MSEYYGIQSPSSDFFMHYGVKGMKWGVRKAIETGNSKALDRHYQKANKKLNKLKRKADIIENLDNRKSGPIEMVVGAIPTAAGVGLPILVKNSKQGLAALGTKGKFLSGLNAGMGAGLFGVGAHDLITGSIRSTSKGHKKAVQKIDNWQQEMKNAFNNTKYGSYENRRPKYDDRYTIYEHGTLGKGSNGKIVVYRAPVVSISGSELVRDKNSKGKEIFIKRLTDPPATQNMSTSKVFSNVQAPSGRVYSPDYVEYFLKAKNKRRRK